MLRHARSLILGFASFAAALSASADVLVYDGFMVIGFLWQPGKYVVYGNGVEIGRLESSRICSVPRGL